MVLLFLWLALPISPPPALTAQSTSNESSIRFDHLSLQEGLSQSTVLAIFQDSKGFMWFGTRHGVNKFDGYEFTVFAHDPDDHKSISNNWITAICEDREGSIWVGTHHGLNKLVRNGSDSYHPGSSRFVRYSHIPGEARSLNDDVVTTLLVDGDGELWVGTKFGLNRFEPKTDDFVRYTLETSDSKYGNGRRVSSLLESSDGSLWIGTLGQGVKVLDSKRQREIHHFLSKNRGDSNEISGNYVGAMFEDADGHVWIGTLGTGLNRFDPRTRSFSHYAPKEQNSAPRLGAVHDIAQDSAGQLWIATSNALWRFNPRSERFTFFNHDPREPSSLSSNNVEAVYYDRAGTLWLGTVLGGIDKYHPDSNQFNGVTYNPFLETGLVDRLVYSFYEEKTGLLWLGTGNGISLFEQATGTFQPLSGRYHNLKQIRADVMAFYEDREGVLWIGTSGQGVFEVQVRSPRDREWTPFQHLPRRGDPNSLRSTWVWEIYEDSRGFIWFGSVGGLSRYNRKEGRFRHFQHDPADPTSLSDNWVRVVFEDRVGNLWIGTEFGGLNVFDPEQETFQRYMNVKGDPNSLGHNSVTSIHEDARGFLWIGTYGGGLNEFDPATGRFVRYTEKRGLANNVVYGILAEERGRLWLSTNGGLSRFDPKTKIFKNYDVDDGLQSNEFNTGAYFKNPAGQMFFGGINGFNFFHPEGIRESRYAPPVVITSVKAFDEPIAAPSESNGSIRLSHKQNFLSFEFVALDYADPGNIRYTYRLNGFDEGWVGCGDRRFVRFTNLPPGDYTFQVRGSNSEGVRSEQTASVRFTIRPPFWRTWWFCTLSVLLLASLIYRLHAYRLKMKLRQVLAVEKVRQRVAADFHDEMGHQLTKISLFSEVVRRKLNGTSPEAHPYVDRIQAVADRLYHGMRDFLWTLDPQKDSLYELAIRLKDFGDEFFDGSGIDFKLEGLDRSLQPLRLSMDRKRHVMLLFKEGMNNILKHARCRSVTLAFKSTAMCVEIKLTDDGVGLATKNGCNGAYGLKNMQYRATRVNGKLTVDSHKPDGTSISLSLAHEATEIVMRR